MTDAPQLPIETDRLLLRPFSRGDVEAVFAYRRREDVARYLADEPMSHEMCVDVVQARVGQVSLSVPDDRLTLAIECRRTHDLVGEVCLILRDRLAGQGELGYVLDPSWQGQGYATEAAAAVIAWGFEGFGLHRIYARCNVANAPSYRLMERLGMRREAHFRDHALTKGRWEEEYVYALVVDEWASRNMQPR